MGRCVLTALQRNLDLGGKESFRASFAFAGGVARNCEVCGALIGGLMAVGLAYASDKLGYPHGPGASVKGDPKENAEVAERYQDVMERSSIICDRFREKFGSLRCADVQRAIRGKFFDLRDPKQLGEYRRPEIHDECAKVSRVAGRLAAEEILKP